MCTIKFSEFSILPKYSSHLAIHVLSHIFVLLNIHCFISICTALIQHLLSQKSFSFVSFPHFSFFRGRDEMKKLVYVANRIDIATTYTDHSFLLHILKKISALKSSLSSIIVRIDTLC